MTRDLRVVPAGVAVLPALRDALAGGPALFVDAEDAADLPATVERRIALVVETSGSTGRPKRVALSADAVLASAAASESALGGPGQWVLALPTHYIAGLNVLVRSIAAGFDPVVVGGPHFAADWFAQAVGRLEQPQRFTALVPAQLATLLDDSEGTNALRELTGVLVGGQSTPGSLLDRARGEGVRVTRSYGSSETSGGCVYDGVPIGTATVRIEDGEVWLGGPTLAEGYLGDPERTAERFVVADGAHWFRTADSGTWDGKRLWVTGRRDDVIISGGLKVSLGEIERIIRDSLYPDAVVVAATDDRWGQVPVVVTTDLARGEIVWSLQELGRAARHTRLLHLNRLPLLPSGKVDRVALTALVARPAE
ncbi:MAG: AMP-binding protein [Pseudolysinimonas sp.]